jgi:hypothetical protein
MLGLLLGVHWQMAFGDVSMTATECIGVSESKCMLCASVNVVPYPEL